MTAAQKNGLAAVLLLGFVLRAAAMNFGLPFIYHADEPIVVNHALAYGAGDFNPHFFKIPPLISYLLFICYGLFFLAGKLTGFFSSAQAFESFFYRDPSVFYFLARLIFGVLAGTLSIYVWFRVLAGYFTVQTALCTALFFSVCFLHVRDSHYVYADIPLILVIVAAFGVFFRLQKEPSMKAHMAAGALIGLAAAVKYNGIALALPYLTAVLLGEKKSSFRMLAAAAAGAAGCFLLLNPFALFDQAFFIRELKMQAHSQGGTPWFHHLTYSLAQGMSTPLLITALAGLARVFFAGGAPRKIVAVFTAGYYLLLVRAGQPYDRYVLPLIPGLVFLAADFLQTLTQKKRKGNDLLVMFALMLSLLPLAKSIESDRVLLAQDVRTEAKKWMEANIPAGSRIALEWEFYMPRLSFSKDQLEEKKKEIETVPGSVSRAQMRKLDFLLSEPSNHPAYRLYFLVSDPAEPRFLFAKPVLPYDFDALKRAGIRYVVRLHVPDKTAPDRFFAQLEKQGRSLAVFSPYKDRLRKMPYDAEPLTGGPVLWDELLKRRANGLALEIYEI